MAELQMLLSDVLDAEKGKLNDQQLKELASRIEGSLLTASDLFRRQDVTRHLQERDWNYIDGALRNLIDQREVSAGGGVNVNTTAQATAVTTVSLGITIETVERGSLTNNEKRELKHELVDADSNAKNGKLAEFAKNAVSACEKAGKCANSLTAVLTLLAELAKGIPTDGSNTERPI